LKEEDRDLLMPIRLYGDPVLRQKARAVTDFGGVKRLAADMLETMYDAHGVGLAAPQVGLPIRLFVAVEYADEEEEGEEAVSRVLNEYVMVNPVLEPLDRRIVEGTEGCLSIPAIYEDGVPRLQAVRIRYQDEEGTERVLEAEDHLARVLQHEFDHLNGRLFLDLLPPAVTATHRAELAEMQRSARAMIKRLREEKRA
jgi:peptide deformylase